MKFKNYKIISALFGVFLSLGSIAQAEAPAHNGKVYANQINNKPTPVTISYSEITSDQKMLRDEAVTYGGVGNMVPTPHWAMKDGSEVVRPVTHTKNQKVKITVQIKVGAGKQVKLVGSSLSGESYFSFSSSTFASTGNWQAVSVTANSPLPDEINYYKPSIKWMVKEVVSGSEKTLKSLTSNYKIYVVWGTPLTTGSPNDHSFPTIKRVNAVVNICKGDDDINDAAKDIQMWRDGAISVSGGKENVSPVFSSNSGASSADFWKLLDGTTTGHCAQGAILMECAARVIGIPAFYGHVYAASTTSVRVYTAASNISAESRTHPHTPAGPFGLGDSGTYQEELWFYSSSSGPLAGWNGGEGCCFIAGRAYTSFWSGHSVGRPNFPAVSATWPTPTISAEHSIIRLLSGSIGPNFQYWYLPTDLIECKQSTPVPAP